MFYLRNFKNFSEAELDLNQAATLIIGPNGAGKSNLIEAIELLSFLAGGHKLHEVTDIGREGQMEVRGGLEACAKMGHDEFTLGFKGALESPFFTEVNYEITVSVRPEPRIIGEVLKIKDRPIPMFELLPPTGGTTSADNQVRYDNNAKGPNKPVESIAADRSALSQYAKFAHGNKRLPDSLAVSEGVVSALASPNVFDPIPKLMRSYERHRETQLARNGYNISPVLYNLQQGKLVIQQGTRKAGMLPQRIRLSQGDVLQRILGRIAQLPDEPFAGFDFIMMPKVGDVMFGFKLKNNGVMIDARLLSDGTLRALAILTALETSTTGSRLILEEFDNGVHPSRVSVMASALFDCAERNKLHVIATTHNPVTMNALTNEQLESVLLVVADQEKDTARLVRFHDLPGYVELVERGRLGDLVTRRVYEQHLRPNYENERKEHIEEWLKSLP